MRYGNKRFLAVTFVLMLAILTACRGKNETDQEQKTPRQKQRVNYSVVVDADSQKAGGIEAQALQPYVYRQQTQAYGEVLSPAGLGEAYKNYVSAKSALQKAAAQLTASQKEYARLKSLNSNNKNVSDRAVQAAEAKYFSDKAEEAGALGALRTAQDAISLTWGPVISGWIAGYSSSLRNVVESKDMLVQITVPPASPFKGAPRHILITSPTGAAVPANFISQATSANPSIQGMSFIYIAPSRSGTLLPGMNVTAQMPSAGTQSGFLVPSSAVVWLQDKAWVYIKKSQTGFNRVEVPTSMPVDEDYFVSGIFSAGDQIVVQGAQALLSAESTPKATGGGGEEGDTD